MLLYLSNLFELSIPNLNRRTCSSEISFSLFEQQLSSINLLPEILMLPSPSKYALINSFTICLGDCKIIFGICLSEDFVKFSPRFLRNSIVYKQWHSSLTYSFFP